MWSDPIIEEVRQAREAWAHSHGNDMQRMHAALVQAQNEGISLGRNPIRLAPKRPAGWRGDAGPPTPRLGA